MDYTFFAPPTHQPYQLFSLPDKTPQTYDPSTGVQQQDPLDAYHVNDPSAYQYFDQTTNFDPSTFVSQSHSPAQQIQDPHAVKQPIGYDRPASISHETSYEAELGAQNLERSSDDDKESLTPAQSRRKAQNRAAQRAFRERKEKHVKELEVKLKSIEAQSTDLLSDNERLRRELERLTTANEILRQTSGPRRRPHRQPHSEYSDSSNIEAGPMAYSPKSFNAAFSQQGHTQRDESTTHEITMSAEGERVLAPGAAWELINSHPLRPQLDLSQVVDKLRDRVRCNGNGPSFLESEIIKAIEESIGAPGDELI